MRISSITLTLATLLFAAPVLRAQEHTHSSGDTDHMAMMMNHHHAAAVDLFLSNRDTLALTEEQVDRLTQLKERLADRGHHGSNQADTAGCATERGVALDRVPGKSVPRGWTRHEHGPDCPMASFSPEQRRIAHDLLHEDMGH